MCGGLLLADNWQTFLVNVSTDYFTSLETEVQSCCAKLSLPPLAFGSLDWGYTDQNPWGNYGWIHEAWPTNDALSSLMQKVSGNQSIMDWLEVHNQAAQERGWGSLRIGTLYRCSTAPQPFDYIGALQEDWTADAAPKESEFVEIATRFLRDTSNVSSPGRQLAATYLQAVGCTIDT